MHCHFVPPYLLRHLTSNTGDRFAIDSGMFTLRIDEEFRSRREALSRAARQPVAAGEATRVIHDAGNTEELPGEVARRDSDPPTGNAAVDEAFDSSAQVWDLFVDQFGRRSVDGEGTPLSVTVHYGSNYDNAFWDGSQLVFGDGDGQVFDRFTKPMDVMAHEFTHGVTQFTAGLTYQGQSGALNESVSDVFASLAKQKSLGQTAEQADWLIGEGLFLPDINAKALRSMTEPGTAYDDPQVGKDPQVGSMDAYVETDEDSGGVHINSGIPNRAFALAALAISGNSWDQAGQIWYDALTGGEVTAGTDFVGFAEATVHSAERLFPDHHEIAEQVRAAWTQVGVLTAQEPLPVDPLPLDPTPIDPLPVDPLPIENGTRIAVSRSGGFTGATKAAELDLDSDPQGPEVRSLLSGVDPQLLTVSPTAPDRFLYTVSFGNYRFTVPEQDLTPELHRVVQIVLGPREGGGVQLPDHLS